MPLDKQGPSVFARSRSGGTAAAAAATGDDDDDDEGRRRRCRHGAVLRRNANASCTRDRGGERERERERKGVLPAGYHPTSPAPRFVAKTNCWGSSRRADVRRFRSLVSAVIAVRPRFCGPRRPAARGPTAPCREQRRHRGKIWRRPAGDDGFLLATLHLAAPGERMREKVASIRDERAPRIARALRVPGFEPSREAASARAPLIRVAG